MRWFGHGREEWMKAEDLAPVPEGRACDHCEEAIALTDHGVVMPHVRLDGMPATSAFHVECHMRQVVGSVGHQLNKCSCAGGVGCGDPAGMTRREAAIAAWAYARESLR